VIAPLAFVVSASACGSDSAGPEAGPDTDPDAPIVEVTPSVAELCTPGTTRLTVAARDGPEHAGRRHVGRREQRDRPGRHAAYPRVAVGARHGGGAAAEVLKLEIPGTTQFTITTPTALHGPRHYASVDDAARDNSLSRIYVGFHWRAATVEGERLGRLVGR